MRVNTLLREKAIKGLECCLNEDPVAKACEKCPYECIEDTSCIDILMADALAQLKQGVEKDIDALDKQEAMKPACVEYDRSIVLFSCRDCRTQLLFGQRYCHMCGRKVEWNASD